MLACSQTSKRGRENDDMVDLATNRSADWGASHARELVKTALASRGASFEIAETNNDGDPYTFEVLLDSLHCPISQKSHATRTFSLLVNLNEGKLGTVRMRCESSECLAMIEDGKTNNMDMIYPPQLPEHLHQMWIRGPYTDSIRGDLMLSLMGNDIKLSDQKHGFLYNAKTALWEPCTGSHLTNVACAQISPYLYRYVLLMEDYLAIQEGLLNELEQELKQFNGTKEDEILLHQKLAEQNKQVKRAKKDVFQYTEQYCAFGNQVKKTAAYQAIWQKRLDTQFGGHTANETYPYLLPIANKRVVDLRDGTVIPRLRDHMFVYECTNIEYKGNLHDPTPHADRFFAEIMGADLAKIENLRSQLGYFLTAETCVRMFWIWIGPGANGKGLTMLLMQSLLGAFYGQASRNVVIQSSFTESGGQATPHLIAMRNSRLTVSSELRKNDVLNDSLLKTITGEDCISARQLYGQQSNDIELKTKLVIQTNIMPEAERTPSMEDRAAVTEFPMRFVAGDKPLQAGELRKDTEFAKKLRTEYLHEVFRWVLRGAVRFYENNKEIRTTQESREFGSKKLFAKDPLALYMDECVEIGPCDESQNQIILIQRDQVFKNYQIWCKSNNETSMKAMQFYEGLANRGIKEKKYKGVRMLCNIKLIDLAETLSTI